MLLLISLVLSFSIQAHTIHLIQKGPLEIIKVGHPTLNKVAKDVDLKQIQTNDFQTFVDDMIETMKSAGGVGLAAPQVNISKRLFVMKPSFLKEAEAIINPTIDYIEEKGTKKSTEGCLSIPGKRFSVTRYKELNMTYLNRYGEFKAEHAKGFRAIVIQHEYDHLNGELISNLYDEYYNINEFEELDIPQM